MAHALQSAPNSRCSRRLVAWRILRYLDPRAIWKSFVKANFAFAVTAIAVSLAASPTSLAQGSADAGKRLAQQWCSSCHQVEPTAPAKDVAPPFASLGVQKDKDPGWIRAWLTNPHPPMQGINLSRQQIDDIVAYLQKLAPAH